MNSFSSDHRLKKNAQFKEIFLKGKKFQTDALQVHYYFHSKNQKPKLGIAASKRYGKAVKRNAFKRLSRESFRLFKDKLPSSIQIIFRPVNEPTSLKLQDFEKALVLLHQKIQEPYLLEGLIQRMTR